MKTIDTSGKTVEDPIKSGLKELNCDLADVEIDVLEAGSPGLFGMFGKLARVRLRVKEDDSFDLRMPTMSLDAQEEDRKPEREKPKAQKQPKSDPKPAPQKPAPQKPAPSKPALADQRKAEKPPEPQPSEPKPKAPRPEKRHSEPRPPRPAQEHDTTPIQVSLEDLPETDYDALSATGKRAYDFLQNVTQKMGVNVEIRIRESEGHLEGQMIGDSLGVLIGRRGDTLDALQYLTSLQVNKDRENYVRVTLDTEHYRAKRVDALSKLANRMANRVRKTGHRVALEPMNPYERRILHSALQGNPYVTTHSEGEEPYRRVIITLK